MKIHKQTIFDLIVANAAKAVITHYYSYNTGTVGDSYIAEVGDIYSHAEAGKPVIDLVNHFHDEATKRLGINRDNKTAVACIIPGIAETVHFVVRDSAYIICFEIAERHGNRYEVPSAKKQEGHSGGSHDEGEE